MKFFLLIALASACSSYATSDIKTDAVSIQPGEVRWVEFPATDATATFICRNEEQKWSMRGNKGRAIIMESYFSDLHPYKCRLEKDGKTIHEFAVTVTPKEYKAEVLKVDSKRIVLKPKDQARAEREQVVLDKIYASSQKDIEFDSGFIQPMNSAITSVYGTKRVYNNQKKGQHLGTDYRAAVGENVPAANDGIVMFSGDLFYTGGTVIIDHGLDVFTVYGHLSKTTAVVGKKIKKGESLGKSGATGRVSGPHLHWGVKIHGQYIDGLSLIDETQKYFKK